MKNPIAWRNKTGLNTLFRYGLVFSLAWLFVYTYVSLSKNEIAEKSKNEVRYCKKKQKFMNDQFLMSIMMIMKTGK